MKLFESHIVKCVLGILVLLQFGCAGTEETQDAVPSAGIDFGKQPKRIIVQHILIGFKGSVRGKSIQRSQEQAESLAQEIYQKAKSGENFDNLVKQYTDDSHPGIYAMVNYGQQGNSDDGIYTRRGMVPVFGDVGFALQVGEIGLGEYSPTSSKYGWHIIKRLE